MLIHGLRSVAAKAAMAGTVPTPLLWRGVYMGLSLGDYLNYK